MLGFDLERIKIATILRSRLPLGRFVDSDEVARVILFLAGDLSSYMNGAIIPVDGGFPST